MTLSLADITDADLIAYLDGQAPDALHQRIEAGIAEDESFAQRVASLDIPIDALKRGFEDVLSLAPPAPALPAPRRLWRERGLRAGIFGTGLAAGLAAAMVLGFGAPAPEPEGWKAVVASYQSLYGAQTLTGAPTPDQAAAQLLRVSDALGLNLTTLPEPEGLSFRRAQLLEFRGRTLVQIAYQRQDGLPVALCIIATDDSQALQNAQMEGLAAASWSAGGFGYLVIGGQSEAALLPAAQRFAEWSEDA